MTFVIMNRRRLLAAVASAAALLAIPGLAHADPLQTPNNAPVTGGIPLINSAETVGPGIDLQHVKALDEGGWYDAQFLTVDLGVHGRHQPRSR